MSSFFSTWKDAYTRVATYATTLSQATPDGNETVTDPSTPVRESGECAVESHKPDSMLSERTYYQTPANGRDDLEIVTDIEEDGTSTPTLHSQRSLSRTLSREDAPEYMSEIETQGVTPRAYHTSRLGDVDGSFFTPLEREDTRTTGSMRVWASLDNQVDTREDDLASIDGEPESNDDTLVATEEMMEYTPSSTTSNTLVAAESSPSKSNLEINDGDLESEELMSESGMMTPKALQCSGTSIAIRTSYRPLDFEESVSMPPVDPVIEETHQVVSTSIAIPADSMDRVVVPVEPLDGISDDSGSEEASPPPEVYRMGQRDWKRGQRRLNRTKSVGDVAGRKGAGVRKMNRPGVKRVVSAREEMLSRARTRFWDGRNSRQQQNCYS